MAMRFSEEICVRTAWHRRLALEAERGPMSEKAFEELQAAVAENTDTYLDDASDRALNMVYNALLADDAARSEEEFMDDASYEAARAKRYSKMRSACEAALELDSTCLDARLVLALTESHEPHITVGLLRTLVAAQTQQDAQSESPSAQAGQGAHQDASYEALMRRPYLRLLAATSRAELECACYTRARTCAEQLIKLDPTDEYGARFTLAIALARLEDEVAFNALDARFAHSGNAWNHLARTLLMFKLDRMSAARRALRGYASLCRGGSYALLRPVFVEPYIPQRPLFEPGSFEEAVLAVHECDPVVMDTPDFLAWAAAQDDFTEQAQSFAHQNDLDW